LKLVKITGDTFYIPGMTNIGVYKDYVIDPGKNENVDWERPETSFGRKVPFALITHAHNDHFWHAADLRNKGTKIYAPRGERPMIENIDIHTNTFFFGVKPPEGMKPWYFKGTPCIIDGLTEELDSPLKAIPLNGHTDWQVGFMTPDGVLMAGDAIVARKVWENPGIVYYTNIPDARRTLKYLMDCDADFVMPSHTEVLTREEATKLAQANLDGLDHLEHIILDVVDKEGISIEETVSRVCIALKMRDEFSVHLVGETTVRAFLHALYGEGIVDYELTGHKVLWRKK